MNILLLSDSHGHPDRIREAAERTRPDCILFAGDGLRDLAGAHTAPDVPVYAVRGNCDAQWDPLTAQYPEEQILVLDGVRILLSGEGYHIIEAENGTRALEVFRPEVDLVILAIMMPGMSGLRVCEELRKLSTVPILFLTAKSQESDKLLGLTAGGDDYLPKPFSFAELSARVKALLRRYCVYQGKGQAPARAENLTLCSHGVKLALDCNRPVLTVSQMNRACELRSDKAYLPVMSDLRDSGTIEQVADCVAFIYRPERYGFTRDEKTGHSLVGVGKIYIAKNRNGSIGIARFRYNPSFTRITDYIQPGTQSTLALS